jgi:methionyl-tRNA formyltransferase
MNPPYRVIFCGTPDIAVPFLEALLHTENIEVLAVVSQPDRPVGRKQVLTASPVKQVAIMHGIPVIQPEKITSKDIVQYEYDYLVVVAYGQILSSKLLSSPKVASINVHMSLLPRWRGASPIQASIAANDAHTGITIQKMVKQLDAGDILKQVSIPILPADTSHTIATKLTTIGIPALIDTLLSPLQPVPQEESQATFCHKLSRADGVVHTDLQTAADIERTWRAYHPWPGVTTVYQGRTIKLLDVSLEKKAQSMGIPCANQTVLYVHTLQEPGGNSSTGLEWSKQL